jgi:hypothetical protein
MMDENSMPMFTEPISDEAAHALSEILSWLSITFDNTYYGQIRRHHDEINDHRDCKPGLPPASK